MVFLVMNNYFNWLIKGSFDYCIVDLNINIECVKILVCVFFVKRKFFWFKIVWKGILKFFFFVSEIIEISFESNFYWGKDKVVLYMINIFFIWLLGFFSWIIKEKINNKLLFKSLC